MAPELAVSSPVSDVDHSVPGLLGLIVGNIQHLVRAEIRLARAELRTDLVHLKHGATLLAMAVVVVVLGLGVLLLAAVYGLATIMPPWAAALVVAAATLAVGGVCAASAMTQLRAIRVAPSKTMSTIQETIQWTKTLVK